jgi:hypothetical protein
MSDFCVTEKITQKLKSTIMKKLVLLLIAFTAFTFTAQSQNSTDTTKSGEGTKKGCFKISSLSIASGVNKYRSMGHDEFEFGKPDKDQSNWYGGNTGFMKGNNNMDNITSRNQVILEMGLNPWSKKLGEYNKKRELTIGLYYSGSNLEDRFHESFTSTQGDTFTFNTIKYQTDTVARTTQSNVVKANVIGASIQYLFKTDPERRFSLFTGIGIDVAVSITARVHERYTKDSAVVLSFSGTNPDLIGNYEFDKGDFLGNEEQRSSISSNPYVFTSVFVPFGVNFRLCKKKDIWNQMSLFMKGNMGLEAEMVVGGKPHFNPYMGCAMGFKFDFK